MYFRRKNDIFFFFERWYGHPLTRRSGKLVGAFTLISEV